MKMVESSRTIVLIDGFDDGHHLTHLRNYAQVLLEMGHCVLELLPDPTAVEPWLRERCPESMRNIHFDAYCHEPVESPSWRLRRIYEPLVTWRRAGRAVRRASEAAGVRPDLVFFCWLDDYIVGASRWVPRALPWVFPYRWSGLFFHPWHLRIAGGETRGESVRAEALLRSAHCPAVAVLDRGVELHLSSNIGKPVVSFPDETEEALPGRDPELAKQIRTLAAGRKVIGLPGNLSRRKGVVSLLDAAAASRDRDWFFVFIGPMGEGQLRTFNTDDRRRVCEAAHDPASNIFFHTERVDDERDFNAAIATCDALYAAYEMFAHSSGIVTKAGVFEKPVIVSKGFYMEEVVREFRLGLAVDPHDTVEVVEAIETLLNPAAFKKQVGQPDYKGFRQTHSVEALKPVFARILEGI